MKKSFIFCLITLFVMLSALSAEAAYLVYQHGSLPLVTQKIKVEINNQVAVTRLEMVFYNPNEHTIQPNIRFPIHEKASVQQFSLTDSEGMVYSGTIEESNKATQIFNEAKAEGLMPAMAVQKKPGVFETSIGAIGPKARATVMIEYSEILPYSRGNINYKLPFDIKQNQPGNLETVAISMAITDQKEIARVESVSHDIYAEKVSGNNWNVVFEKNNYLPSGDFMLNYEVKAEALATNFLTTKPEADKDGYFMLMLSPAEIISAEDIAMRDIVFVVDTSGSMSGRKMEQTKTAFEFFVNRLNENDRFGIISFSSMVNTWQPELLPVTSENRTVAREFIQKLNASGGTNINGSLLSALSLFDKAEGRTRTLVFLTDGEASTGVTDTNSIVNNFNSANTAQVRTFTLGVGRGVNTALLNKLAIENRGEALYLEERTQNIDKELMSFYESISTPLLVDLALNWGDVEVADVYPKTLPNIYQGTQLVITGRYKNGATADLALTGNLNTVKHSFPINATFAELSNDNLFVSRFWAKAKADDLMLQMQTYGQNQKIKDEVIALSKEYQFATPFTSFVAVSTTPVPQVSQHAATHSSARNLSTMARPTNRSGLTHNTTGTTRTIVRRTEAKQLSLWGAAGFIPAAIAIPNFRKARQQARPKACYANQRVLMGAIEMYNMDQNVMIDVVTPEVMDLLVQGKYLKSPLVMADTNCNFGAVGDISKDGYVICALHGSPEMPISDDSSSEARDIVSQGTFYDVDTNSLVPGTVSKIEIRYESETWFTRIWNNWLADAVNLLINVPLLIIGLALNLYIMYIILKLPFKAVAGIYAFFTGKDSD